MHIIKVQKVPLLKNKPHGTYNVNALYKICKHTKKEGYRGFYCRFVLKKIIYCDIFGYPACFTSWGQIRVSFIKLLAKTRKALWSIS